MRAVPAGQVQQRHRQRSDLPPRVLGLRPGHAAAIPWADEMHRSIPWRERHRPRPDPRRCRLLQARKREHLHVPHARVRQVEPRRTLPMGERGLPGRQRRWRRFVCGGPPRRLLRKLPESHPLPRLLQLQGMPK